MTNKIRLIFFKFDLHQQKSQEQRDHRVDPNDLQHIYHWSKRHEVRPRISLNLTNALIQGSTDQNWLVKDKKLRNLGPENFEKSSWSVDPCSEPPLPNAWPFWAQWRCIWPTVNVSGNPPPDTFIWTFFSVGDIFTKFFLIFRDLCKLNLRSFHAFSPFLTIDSLKQVLTI